METKIETIGSQHFELFRTDVSCGVKEYDAIIEDAERLEAEALIVLGMLAGAAITDGAGGLSVWMLEEHNAGMYQVRKWVSSPRSRE